MPHASDQIADTNRAELVRLAKLYEFPDFVKRASLDDIMTPRTTTSVYADPVRRQFPCDDRASTWLSSLFFLEKKSSFHPKDQARIQQRLEHYVDYWQQTDDYAALKAKHAELHKSAEEQLPDTAFAWVRVNEDGTQDRRLRLTSAMEVKCAAEYLFEYRDRMPFEVRHGIARRIKAAQAKFGATLAGQSEFVDRQAGLGVCQPAEVVQLLRRRHEVTKESRDRTCSDQYLQLATAVAGSPERALTPHMLIKLAGTVEQLDRASGVIDRYSDYVQRPEDVIFSATFDKAAAALTQHAATVTGAVYEKAALTKISLDDLTALFGTDFSERVRTGLGVDGDKLAEELGALPYPDAKMIEGLLSEAGIAPVMRKAASARLGFNPAQQQALARLHSTC